MCLKNVLFVTIVSSYPTSQNYTDMVEWIFKRWSHIPVQQACYEDAVSLWKSRMKTLFKNTRHRSTDVLEVVARQISIVFKRRHDDNGNLQTNKGAASA